MDGASTVREAVEAAGDRLEVSVRELRDSFGIANLTAAGRERISRELGAKGLRLEPSLARRGLDERVTIVAPRPRPVSIAADPERAQTFILAPWEAPRRSFWSNRRRAVMAGLGVGLLVILVVAAFGWNVGKDQPKAAGTQAASSLRDVDAAVAQDDTDSARRILSSVDPDVLRVDADLALQAGILRNRIRFTESYLAAIALAESGRYREARERMLTLIPFRDAGVRARLYGVEIAKELVTRARTEAPVRPDRAVALLDQAEDIAPSLSSITEVRTEASGG